jgi:hypothetical protein
MLAWAVDPLLLLGSRPGVFRGKPYPLARAAAKRSLAILRVVAQTAERARSLEHLERARRAEQARLDALKTATDRNRLGQFATPPGLALDIAREAHALWRVKGRSRGPVRFLDPALGTGAFYRALRAAFPARAIAHAAGIELDPHFARAARNLWSPTGLRVTRADFTRARPPPADDRFNLVMANPPYVRHHHLPTTEKRRLQEHAHHHLGLHVSGLAGLYCHFLLLCDRWMTDGALALWLIPAEFMEVGYGAALRRYLSEHVTLRRIHRFDPTDVQFADALVTSGVVVFEKTPPRPDDIVTLTHGGTLSDPASRTNIPLHELRSAPRWPRRAAPGAPGAPPAAPAARPRPTTTSAETLGDLFHIKRGLATGANSFFIIHRADAAARGIPDAALRPLLPGPKDLATPVIHAAPDGWPALPTQLALIDCTLPEPEIRARYPSFWNYLQSGRRHGIHRGYLASRRHPWYSQERRDPPPFLCTNMGRQGRNSKPFRFLWNRSEALAANVYLLMYPRPPLAQALASHPALAPEIFRALTALDPERLITNARTYGGGLHKLEPTELASLPFDLGHDHAPLPPCTPS